VTTAPPDLVQDMTGMDVRADPARTLST